jgi:hypothetical protein
MNMVFSAMWRTDTCPLEIALNKIVVCGEH